MFMNTALTAPGRLTLPATIAQEIVAGEYPSLGSTRVDCGRLTPAFLQPGLELVKGIT